MEKLRVIYMGTPAFALRPLEALAESPNVDLLCVFTKPDTVRGRGNKLVASPVKELAQSLCVDVNTPNTLRDPDVQTFIKSLAPDLIVVCAYGLILPKEVLDIPAFGCLNIHASVLPRWRGAAPIHRAILAGDETIGVSIMRMEEGLDTGDYYVVGEIEIQNKGIDEIIEELSRLGAIGIMEVIERLSYEFLNSFTVQNEALSTYANKIDKLEVLLDPFLDIDTFLRRVHLSSASLPARCIICGREVIVLDAHPIEENLASGMVRLEKKRILIGVDGVAVQIDLIKPKGKNVMDGLSFKSGLHDVEFSWTSIQF